MSVKVMTAVFERYPNGGGEMLLALALADHASDDGTKVFPSVEALAVKTRQSVRSVQYQLRSMQASGWLILVSAGNGGRSMTSEYRISIDWIKGAEIAPFKNGANDDEKGANESAKGCKSQQETVQPVAPANNRHRTIKEPSGTSGGGDVEEPVDLFEEAWSAYPARSGGNSKADARKAWASRLKAGVDPETIVAGVHRYAAFCLAEGKVGTAYVKQAATFFGPGEHWSEQWAIPQQAGMPQRKPSSHAGLAGRSYSSGVNADGTFA